MFTVMKDFYKKMKIDQKVKGYLPDDELQASDSEEAEIITKWDVTPNNF